MHSGAVRRVKSTLDNKLDGYNTERRQGYKRRAGGSMAGKSRCVCRVIAVAAVVGLATVGCSDSGSGARKAGSPARQTLPQGAGQHSGEGTRDDFRTARGTSTTDTALAGRATAPASATVAPSNRGATSVQNIVGGLPITIQTAPWLAALVHHSDPDAATGQFCGASMLDATTVLTAAHCVGVKPGADGTAAGTRPGDIDVVLGRTRLQDPGGQRIQVKSYAVPAAWDGDATDGADLALLTLTRPAQQVVSLKIPAASTTYGTRPGQQARVQGWGCHGAGPRTVTHSDCSTEWGSGAPPTLKAGVIEFTSAATCAAVKPLGKYFRPASDLCGRGVNKSSTDCWGDSGGPLTVELTDGSVIAVGLVSWGIATNRAGQPICTTDQPSAYSYVANIWNAWSQTGFKSWEFGT